MTKKTETHVIVPDGKVYEVAMEPEQEATLEQTAELEAKDTELVVAIYFSGRIDPLAIPLDPAQSAQGLMAWIEEQRGRSVPYQDIDGQELVIFPAQICFMRVETR